MDSKQKLETKKIQLEKLEQYLKELGFDNYLFFVSSNSEIEEETKKQDIYILSNMMASHIVDSFFTLMEDNKDLKNCWLNFVENQKEKEYEVALNETQKKVNEILFKDPEYLNLVKSVTF